MSKKIIKVFLLFIIIFSSPTFASNYPEPDQKDSLIGQLQYTTASQGDSAVKISKKFNVGLNAIEQANPQYHMERDFPEGAPLQIPSAHLLPDEVRKGIIVNLAEMRMYYFNGNTKQIVSYPIGIGKVNKTIPTQKARIIDKKKNPYWMPTKAIRKFNLSRGVILPKIMPPGEDNPLGTYVIYMSIPTYLFHSASFEDSIGKRASFGCIRMFDTDIKEFFHNVKTNTPIKIINKPIKTGWSHNKLYLETHPALEEKRQPASFANDEAVSLISHKIKKQSVLVDWQLVSYITKERDGIPHQVGVLLP